jgi:hypothetical protein
MCAGLKSGGKDSCQVGATLFHPTATNLLANCLLMTYPKVLMSLFYIKNIYLYYCLKPTKRSVLKQTLR